MLLICPLKRNNLQMTSMQWYTTATKSMVFGTAPSLKINSEEYIIHVDSMSLDSISSICHTDDLRLWYTPAIKSIYMVEC